MLTRLPEWELHLHDFLLKRDPVPFKWGYNDCALFSCDAIRVMTGTDLAAPYRGMYKTEIGSLRAIRKITGGHSIEGAASHAAGLYGMQEVRPSLAGRGDWVLIKNEGRAILGLVHLNGKNLVAVAERGVILLPPEQADRAWRV